MTIYTSKFPSNKLVDWTTHEHKVQVRGTRSLEDFKGNEKVKLQEIDFESEYTVSNEISVVFKADFIRIAKLYEHGGMWFDMDILFVKPFPEVLFESEEDLSVCFYQNTIPTGLILSKPNLSALKFLLDSAFNILSTK